MAQEIKPLGRFLQDSIRIGEPIPYALSLKYPADMEVLFPDSAFNFAPFECSKVWYSPTKADSLFRYDTAVYYLSTYEIDDIQYFQLPIYILAGKDSTLIFADTDSLYFKAVIETLPDSLVLKSNTLLREVKHEINYVLWGIILGAAIIVAIVLLVIFGKGIQRKIKIYRIQRANKKFNLEFDLQATKLSNPATKKELESITRMWKKYLENLESHPYTKLTSKEINVILVDERLKETLRNIDRLIYGNKSGDSLEIKVLQQKANEQFEQKLREIGHE